MKPFPTSLDSNTKPVELDGLSEADRRAIAQLKEQGYEVHSGLSQDYAEAISAMAHQPDMLEYTPRDSRERFSDLSATKQWLTKQRAVYLLIKNEDGRLRLAGYGWAGPAETDAVNGGQTTFAVRVGQADQGKGLATPFTQLIVDASAVTYGARDYWLETWGSNGAATHIYHKLGFVDVSQRDDQRPTAAGGSIADSRIFMSLPNKLLP